MVIKGINHIKIKVKNIDESIKFYCDLLGFKLSSKYDRDDGTKGAKVNLDNFRITFSEQPNIEHSQDTAIDHIAFSVQDIEEVYNKLKQSGIEIGEMLIGMNGKKYAYVYDPNKIKLEIVEV